MYEYDFYDIILDLQSLSNLKEGFQIKIDINIQDNEDNNI